MAEKALSDKELFESAMSAEAPLTEEKDTQEAPPEPKTAAEAKAAEDTEEAAGNEPEAPEQPRQRLPRIPLSEHLAEREKRQVAERERDTFKADNERRDREYQALQRQIAELQRPKTPEPELPDVLADPATYAQSLEKRIEARFHARLVDASFADAHEANGKTFEDAYASLQGAVQNGDVALRERIVNAPNPGKALMRWHQERSAIQEIGGDLKSYQLKMREQLLADPEFRKTAMEKWREVAQGTNGQRSENIPDLPSLNRAAGGGSAAADDSRWESDGELARNVFQPPPRRRA